MRRYRGFMYIKCQKCGREVGRYQRNNILFWKCNCGAKTQFDDPLVPLMVSHECGLRIQYKTNKTEPMFEMTCFDCGAPVTVEWDAKRQLYKTVE